MGRLVRLRQLTGGRAASLALPRALQLHARRRRDTRCRAAPGGAARRRPEGVIERRTFDDLATAAGRWAALLRSRGLAPGDRVLALVGATPAWPAILLGSLKAGLVVIPCLEPASAADVELLLRRSGARLFVVDGANAANLAGIDPADTVVVVVEETTSELRGLAPTQSTHATICDDPALVLYAADGASVAATASHGEMRELWLRETARARRPVPTTPS